MAMDLAVEDYDRIELDEIAKTPNLALEAFQPHQFESTCFPTRIRKEKEFWRYVNLNSTLQFEPNFESQLGTLTPQEFDLAKDLTTKIARFTEERFGRKMLSRANVINSINVLRHITYIYGDARPRVFESAPEMAFSLLSCSRRAPRRPARTLLRLSIYIRTACGTT